MVSIPKVLFLITNQNNVRNNSMNLFYTAGICLSCKLQECKCSSILKTKYEVYRIIGTSTIFLIGYVENVNYLILNKYLEHLDVQLKNSWGHAYEIITFFIFTFSHSMYRKTSSFNIQAKENFFCTYHVGFVHSKNVHDSYPTSDFRIVALQIILLVIACYTKVICAANYILK